MQQPYWRSSTCDCVLSVSHACPSDSLLVLADAGPSGSTSELEATVAGQVNKLDKQVRELSREYDRLHRIIESREGQLHNLHVLEHTNKQIYAAIVVGPSPDALRLDAHLRSEDHPDAQDATTSTPTLPAIQRKPHRGPSPYISRARSASPRHGPPSPLSRSAEWATPRGSAGVHESRSVDFGRSSRQAARGRSQTSLGHSRAHEPRAAGGRQLNSARTSSTHAHHAPSTNGGVNSVHSKTDGAEAEDGEEAGGEMDDLEWDVAPEQASMLREAYMRGLLADTRAFVAGRREVLAVGKTFLQVAARLEKERLALNPTVQAAQAALRQAHEETLKMLATYKEAEHARELASGALRLAQAQLERRRKDWARRLVEKDQVNQLKGDVRALLKSREQQRKAIQAKAQGRREQEAKAKAQALARALGAGAGSGAAERVDVEGEKLSKRFSMMMAASGCKNLRDLVYKVCTQTDQHAHLTVDAEDSKAKVAALREEAARLQSQLRDLHFVEAGMLDNRKKIDLAGEALALAERKAADATLRTARGRRGEDGLAGRGCTCAWWSRGRGPGAKKAKGGRKDGGGGMSAMAKGLQMQTVSRLWLEDARLSAHDDAHADGAGPSSSDEEQDGHSGRVSLVRSRTHSDVESRPPRPPGKGNARTSNFHAPRRKAPLPAKGAIPEAPDADDLLQPVRTREDIKKEAAARMHPTHDAREPVAREPVCVG
ncbi:hypothetical protein KFL_000570085 [Klebsormidium nitens]|uniref:Uncharacterized protein n=1 Tax=Klebsormidium nitens TaxID=105231 RepID=A0A0U9HMI2_KLENI|nr:hypothetical protein KFL_000570085 [Klebsormidium nitens]|eukprot:GAQ80560.1 hypothetical protein KFL_000570085 [Klebsormidium nitens]